MSRALLKLSKSTWSYPSIEYKVSEQLGPNSPLTKTWLGALSETTADPLDRVLSGTNVDLFADLMEDRSDSFGEFLIDSVEIPVLLFDARNDDENDLFSEGMGARRFVEACVTRARTIPFAVHFLRQLDAHLFVTFGKPHNKTLLRFPRFIRFALDGTKGRDPALVDQRPLETTLTTQSVELKRVFVRTTRFEIKQRTFMNNGPQPWTFPITDTSRAPAGYSRDFHITTRDLAFLACDEEFMMLFAISVQLVVWSKITRLPYLEIVLMSARELFVAAMGCPFYTQVSCVIAHVMMQYIRENKDLQVDLAHNKDAKALLALAVGCNPERARLTTETFFVQAQKTYRTTLAT
jgi:hypothetical protein